MRLSVYVLMIQKTFSGIEKYIKIIESMQVSEEDRPNPGGVNDK
jgi:hypothetical protein